MESLENYKSGIISKTELKKELKKCSNSGKLVDSHTHLHVIKDEQLLERIIDSSLKSGISHICENATKEENFDTVINLRNQFPKNMIAGIGIHPYYFESTSSDYIEVKNTCF